MMEEEILLDWFVETSEAMSEQTTVGGEASFIIVIFYYSKNCISSKNRQKLD